MKRKIDKINLILISTVIFLSTTFCLSLCFTDKKQTHKRTTKSALISSSKKDMINSFRLECRGDVIEFRKLRWNTSDSFWFGYEISDTDDQPNPVPCRNDKIEEFLSELYKIRNFEKIKVKKTDSNFSEFGFDYEHSFNIFALTPDDYIGFSFGDTDFTGSKIYVQNQAGDIFLVENQPFEKYLYSGINQWYDPYLIPRELGITYKDQDVMSPTIEGLLELRHGGLSFYKPSENEKPVRSLKIEMGDTSFFELSFYKIPDEYSYHVQINYNNPLKGNGIVPQYAVKISEWTYEKLN